MGRILIVDYHPDICFVLKRLLERNGHETSIALNGRGAINCLEQSPFDLMITDITRPEMNGIELIMRTHFKYPQLKVIAIFSGQNISTDECVQMARVLKVKHAFQKPIRPPELLAAISDLLKGEENIADRMKMGVRKRL
jgi:CheY-like chemotaxis protein